MEPPSLTIGVEEEYQLVDRESRALDSYITQFRDPERTVLREQATSELLQSVLEVTSADRQRAVRRETDSLEAVVDHLVEETTRGVR